MIWPDFWVRAIKHVLSFSVEWSISCFPGAAAAHLTTTSGSMVVHFCSVGYSHSWRGASGCRRHACLCLTHRLLFMQSRSWSTVRVEFHTSFNPVYKFPHRLPQMFLSRVTLDSVKLTVSVTHRKGKCSVFSFFSVKIKTSRKKYTLDYVLEKI